MTETAANAVECFELPRPDGEGVFVISLSRPQGLATASRDTPVLYMLDADIGFGMAAEIAHYRAIGGALPDPIVVGVGYGADFATMAKLRTGDLTPPLGEEGRKDIGAMASLIGESSGGADAFLRFILEILAPEVARRVPQASKTHRILFGHSLGGLFVAFALLTRPDAFPIFAASSPSLWWDGFSALKRLPDFAERLKGLPTPPRVLIAVGAKEQDVPTKTPPGLDIDLADIQAMVARARMIDAAREFAETLRGMGVTDLEFVAFTGEDHSSTVPAALSRAITFALAAET